MKTHIVVIAALTLACAAWGQDDDGGAGASAEPERQAPGASDREPATPPAAAGLTGERAGKYEGFYVRGGLALIGVADSDLVASDGATRETEFDPGYGGSAAVGYDFGSLFQPEAPRERLTINLRSEVEFSFERVDADDEGVPGGAQLKKLWTRALALNTYIDFDTPTRWTFYAGLGVGAAQVKTEGTGHNDRDTAGLVQLMGGAIFEVSESTSLYAGLRSRGYSDIDAGTAELEDLASGALEVGLIFSF